MPDKFKPINLRGGFNSPARLRAKPRGKAPAWNAEIERQLAKLPRGNQTYWGIPFRLGPKDLARKGLVIVAGGRPPVEVPVQGQATHLCVLHFCDIPEKADAAGGEAVAEYVLRYADGTEHVRPIRRRFEINPFMGGWGSQTFAAMSANMPQSAPDDATKIGWGPMQTGVVWQGPGFGCWVYALENPAPDKALKSVLLRSVSKMPAAILGMTMYNGPGHPLRHVPRRVYRLILPAGEKVTAKELDVNIDLGIITRVYAVPGLTHDQWLKAAEAGLGLPRPKDQPQRDFLVEATGSEGATLTVKAGKKAEHEIDLGQAWNKGSARSADGKARLELLHPGKTWVHVTVVDSSTGKPTPTRAHFRGTKGEYIPPYGHHGVVNERWFEDYGGDLQLGDMSYAYVPGRFQIELPVGEVYVELSKGFEYAPMRRKLEIRPGQRELELKIDRTIDRRKEGWVTADTHVHFISPETAWLEGQAEGLNLINLLASQWGRLFTNVADITGELSGVSRQDTLVWVGTENRNHLLGHISMLGTHGDPVFPMCDGGPGEAYIGDPEIMTLTEWAQTCRERDGVVIRPHFPSPVCEEPVYFALGQLDGAELRRYGDPAESLDEFCYTEWYRYLNCGYRVAAVGGTDKMSAGMPVGGARTYARLDPNDEFSFANWGKAVRAGRTFTSSGPIVDLRVEGRELGDLIHLPSGGGTLEVEAVAECIWPIHALELVMNGKVIGKASDAAGAKRLRLKQRVRVQGSSWIAARCGSKLVVQHCWPIHLGAHTSPVYIIAGGEEQFSPSDASYMLTLIDGGITYLETLSVRFDEQRHRAMKAVFERARAKLHSRMHAHGHSHSHGR